GEVTPRVGQYVAAGTQLMYLIPQQTWVIANFKETQIADMKLGQKASFTVEDITIIKKLLERKITVSVRTLPQDKAIILTEEIVQSLT
ncbi:MAG: hypothetical protein RSC48_07145, partial [Anaerorhabdus sp.]